MSCEIDRWTLPLFRLSCCFALLLCALDCRRGAVLGALLFVVPVDCHLIRLALLLPTEFKQSVLFPLTPKLKAGAPESTERESRSAVRGGVGGYEADGRYLFRWLLDLTLQVRGLLRSSCCLIVRPCLHSSDDDSFGLGCNREAFLTYI